MNRENESMLEITRSGPVTRVVLDRPRVHNALDEGMMRAIHDAFLSIRDDETRVVVLAGKGKSFCAGADVHWMKRMAGCSMQENVRDAALLQDMLAAIHACPKPVIARVHGAALAGGIALAAVSDIVVAAPGAVFGVTEVKLGLVPATIAPYVLLKIGPSHARDLFLTGERFSADHAARIGLVHHVVPAEELDAMIDRKIDELLSSAPGAVATAKAMIGQVIHRDPADVASLTVDTLARARVSAEGREGLNAFLERRSPSFKTER